MLYALSVLCVVRLQNRSMAARSSKTARWGNIIAGIVLMGFSVPFGLLGGFARKYHGPDSVYAEFAADTCSAPLGLPSCAQWLPDDKFVLFKYLWERVPRVSLTSRCFWRASYRPHIVAAGGWDTHAMPDNLAFTYKSSTPTLSYIWQKILTSHFVHAVRCLQLLGGWTVLAILCASMSTATGAILATSTVMAHNIFRKVRHSTWTIALTAPHPVS